MEHLIIQVLNGPWLTFVLAFPASALSTYLTSVWWHCSEISCFSPCFCSSLQAWKTWQRALCSNVPNAVTRNTIVLIAFEGSSTGFLCHCSVLEMLHLNGSKEFLWKEEWFSNTSTWQYVFPLFRHCIHGWHREETHRAVTPFNHFPRQRPIHFLKLRTFLYRIAILHKLAQHIYDFSGYRFSWKFNRA